MRARGGSEFATKDEWKYEVASVHLKFREEITWRIVENVLQNHGCHREG